MCSKWEKGQRKGNHKLFIYIYIYRTNVSEFPNDQGPRPFNVCRCRVQFFLRAATLKYIILFYFYMGKGTFAFNANEAPPSL